MYGFKREVVAADFGKQTNKEGCHKYDAETKRLCKNKNEKKQNWGKNLYRGKYGNSIYEPENMYENVKKEKKDDQIEDTIYTNKK